MAVQISNTKTILYHPPNYITFPLKTFIWFQFGIEISYILDQHVGFFSHTYHVNKDAGKNNFYSYKIEKGILIHPFIDMFSDIHTYLFQKPIYHKPYSIWIINMPFECNEVSEVKRRFYASNRMQIAICGSFLCGLYIFLIKHHSPIN